jgi:hypothetical protein
MQNATTGAEARSDFAALRGAEAPLFHGSVGIPQRWSAAPPKIHPEKCENLSPYFGFS